MNTITRTEVLFVNENGMTVCTEHAGRYLTAALKNGSTKQLIETPLDVWLRVEPNDPMWINEKVFCEVCK